MLVQEHNENMMNESQFANIITEKELHEEFDKGNILGCYETKSAKSNGSSNS